MCRSRLLDELRFQAHGPDAIDFTIDVVIAVDEANVLHPRPDFDDLGGAFHLQVFEDDDRIAVLQCVSGRVAINPAVTRDGGIRIPFMRAFRANAKVAKARKASAQA